jgi:hypothetical protein
MRYNPFKDTQYMNCTCIWRLTVTLSVGPCDAAHHQMPGSSPSFVHSHILAIDRMCMPVQAQAKIEAGNSDKLKQQLTLLEGNLCTIKAAAFKGAEEGVHDSTMGAGAGGAPVAAVLSQIRSLQERLSMSLSKLQQQTQDVEGLKSSKAELQCVFTYRSGAKH